MSNNSADELTLDPANANRGTDRGRSTVTESLEECGAGRSILADKNGMIIAGNKTLEAARKLGLPIRVVESAGNELVVVRRTDLALDEGDRARRLAYLDNRSSELGLEWDLEQLLADLAGGIDLGGCGFTEDELAALFAQAAPQPGLTDPDEVPDLPEEPVSKPGDLWLLGEHRVLCGDSTSAADVERLLGGALCELVWTDPPWNVAYGESNHPTWRQRTIENDNLGDAFPAFVADFCALIATAVKPGAPIYMAMSAQEWPVIHAALSLAGFHWSSTIIWVKDHAVLSRKDYHTRYEPLWYGWREGAARLAPLKDRKQNDVWEINRPTRSEEHPTMKPVELVARSLDNSSRAGNRVFDPFLGSGTTLIAAEMTGRVCCGLEIDPRYTDLCVTRWENFTGRRAERVEV